MIRRGLRVDTPGFSAKRNIKSFSIRRNVNRRIFRFSLCIGAVVVALTAIVYIAAAYPSLKRAEEINLRTISEMNCSGFVCDTSEFTTDWQLEGSDYVIDTQSRFFLTISPTTAEHPSRFAPLDFADTTFITGFREPTSYRTPNDEVWRLYSRRATWNGKDVEIMIGYAEKAPWKMLETPPALIPVVDADLKREAEQIANNFAPVKGKSLRSAKFTPKLSADGFAVADAITGEVFVFGPQLPMFLPKEKILPREGPQPYIDTGDVYIAQTDTNGRLVATSIVSVGSYGWFAITEVLVFIGAGLIARGLSRRFLRNYFAAMGVRVPDLQEALSRGEGQNVEFKRGLSEEQSKASSVEDELLKSTAAFANTNDGIIFIGVDDGGRIRGLRLDFSQRDRFEQKVRQLIRNRIKPTPPTQVSFEEVRGLIVAKIAVARGEAPIYLLNGTIYVRDGSSDVQAQPDHLKRLVAEFAF